MDVTASAPNVKKIRKIVKSARNRITLILKRNVDQKRKLRKNITKLVKEPSSWSHNWAVKVLNSLTESNVRCAQVIVKNALAPISAPCASRTAGITLRKTNVSVTRASRNRRRGANIALKTVNDAGAPHVLSATRISIF